MLAAARHKRKGQGKCEDRVTAPQSQRQEAAQGSERDIEAGPHQGQPDLTVKKSRCEGLPGSLIFQKKHFIFRVKLCQLFIIC